MPPDQLTAAPDAAENAVRAVLAGLPIPDAARQHNMHPADLTDAVAVYDQAGCDALARHTAAVRWRQINLHFTNWTTAAPTFTAHVLPLLDQADAEGAIDGWWYTRKHPCWRLRLRTTAHNRRSLAPFLDGLDHLADQGHLHRWWPGIYEPETAAFGGKTSMTAAHTLFITDSGEIQRTRQLRLALGPRELSVLLCTTMLCAAGLEWYEQGDVWHRVITHEHRNATADIPTEHLTARANEIRPLLLADSAGLQHSGGPLAPVTGWIAAFQTTGQTLRRAARTGDLDRGLRHILSYHILFHWNRLGLTMRGQSILAWAAREAILGGGSARGHGEPSF